MTTTPPVALTVAGSDSGGGAGIQADLKTFQALGVFGTSAITLVTAQNTRGVARVDLVAPEAVAAQIAAVREDLAPAAVKIGALGAAEIVEAVAAALEGFAGPIVLDPVMVAKSGDRLLSDDAVAALRERLLPMAALVTPNLPEAAALAGLGIAGSLDEAEAQGRALLGMGARAVLVKGGHGEGAEATDILIGAGPEPAALAHPRVATCNTHGTGCTLSAAICARLAHGDALAAAVAHARDWLQGAIAGADRLGLGQGTGPLDHAHALTPWHPPAAGPAHPGRRPE